MRFPILLLLFMSGVVVASRREKRQFSIDDLIHRALSLVRPIFDTSQPLQDDSMINRQINEPTMSEGIRQQSILGVSSRTLLDDIPLCKGDSRLCQFISCQAENFKKDQSFANLNLAAQVLGDKKLRKAVSSNPEAISAVCEEQGMTESQCKLFSKGFQLIDNFITTVEGPEPGGSAEQKKKRKEQQEQQAEEEQKEITEETQSPAMQRGESAVPGQEQNNKGEQNGAFQQYPITGRREPMEDEPIPIGKSPSRMYGSKTWSSLPDQLPGRYEEQKNDLVASFTPLPMGAFGPPGHFIHPTVPTAPPLAFPNFPTFPPMDMQGILALQPLKMPGLTIEKPFIQFNQDEYQYMFVKKSPNDIRRQKRETSAIDEDAVDVETPVRVKRDYYDDLNQARRNLGFGKSIKSQKEENKGESDTSDDYYTQTADDDPKPKTDSKDNGMRNCLELLG